MPKTLKVALTGGVGTGKSEALKAFCAAGVRVLSLDAVAHELCKKGGPAYRSIVREFGAGILDERGNINRRVLGERVFSRPALKRKLEALTHPLILRRMRRFLRSKSSLVAVADVPLLYETALASEFDVTMLISAGPEVQLRRVMARDDLGPSAALRRIKAQWPMARKERLADVVICNEGSRGNLRRTVRQYQRAFELIAS